MWTKDAHHTLKETEQAFGFENLEFRRERLKICKYASM